MFSRKWCWIENNEPFILLNNKLLLNYKSITIGYIIIIYEKEGGVKRNTGSKYLQIIHFTW
jgi:hypothetical protein